MPRADRMLAPLTLFWWGALLTYFYCSHRLAALLHPDFHWPVLAAGFLLLGASACVLLQGRDPEEETGCGCNHCKPPRARMSPGQWFAFLVLLVPITAAAWISPDHYSQVMVQNRGVSDLPEEVLAGMPPTVAVQPGQADPPLAVEVGDLLMASQTASGRETYAGKQVELTGQVFSLGPNRFELVRMLMLCCAADAQILAVRVEGSCAVPAMQWAKVTGQVRFAGKGGLAVPVVTAGKVVSVPRPDNPYVYRGGSPIAASRTGFKIPLPPR